MDLGVRREKMKAPGFTMIETLLASCLTLLIIVATAQLMARSLAAQNRADFHFRASVLASSKLEHLKSLAFDSQDLVAGLHQEVIVDGLTGEIYQVESNIAETGESAKTVVLRISPQTRPQWQAVFCLILSKELEF
jgi:Tfp pilus assembly protein PilV